MDIEIIKKSNPKEVYLEMMNEARAFSETVNKVRSDANVHPASFIMALIVMLDSAKIAWPELTAKLQEHYAEQKQDMGGN